MIRIAAVSDCHSQFRKLDLEDADMLICAGDMTNIGSHGEMQLFSDWLGSVPLPKERKIVIAGNHDLMFEKDPAMAREYIGPVATYLQDSFCHAAGLKIYGTPWIPPIWGAFQADHEKMTEILERIPESLDILVTHSPVAGILDTVENRRLFPLGSKALKTRLQVLKSSAPKIVISGHIHSSHGSHVSNVTTYYNVACCDEQNQLKHGPTFIEVH